MHVDLISKYRKSIIKQKPGGAIIWKNAIMTCMKMIDPATGWFEIFRIPTFDLDVVMAGNYEYMDKLFIRIFQLFNNTRL